MSTKPNPTILDLDHDQARRLLMQPESYCNVPLPEYYDFTEVLSEAGKLAGKYRSSRVTNNGLQKSMSGNVCSAGYRPDSCEIKHIYEGVNYRVLANKDGLLSWRPLELINPIIYSTIVFKLTEQANWELVRDRFAEFQQNKRIECCSIPRGVFTYAQKSSIMNWWESFEQRSIALSLEFPYVGKTDISDCYGAIYTHSISWALHGKVQAKHSAAPMRGSKLIGDYIDSEIQNMHSRQTVGIPQGSVLSDLIAEMVLGYADLLLSEELEKELEKEKQSALADCNYKILRYRDDYRIFASSREGVHSILLALMKVLSGLNFKLGAAKTSISDDVVLSSVKADKVDWLMSGCAGLSVHKWLLVLSRFARDYPHSGTLVRELQKISNYLESAERFPDKRDVLVAQVVDIVVRNPRCYPIGARILSLLLGKEGSDIQSEFLDKIMNRCRMIPNSGLFEIWLQRVARVLDIKMSYEEPLCCAIESLVAGDRDVVNPWPWQWMRDPVRADLEALSIIDIDKLNGISAVISSDEIGDLSSYPRAGA